MNKNESNKETSWGNVAEWYNELIEASPDSFQAKVILPNITRILGDIKGKSVLDIACGQGFFARAFSLAGGVVAGCDISPELIKIAREANKNLKFEATPSHELGFVGDGTQDVAVIILAIQNIEKLGETFDEAFRTLKVGGRLILVLNHPAFRIPQASGWEWDEKESKQYRRIDAYLSDSRVDIDMTPGERDLKKKKMTISFHRPLQVYFKSLNKAGFAVSRLEEWISHKVSQKGPRSSEEDRIRKEIPMFLMLEATK